MLIFLLTKLTSDKLSLIKQTYWHNESQTTNRPEVCFSVLFLLFLIPCAALCQRPQLKIKLLEIASGFTSPVAFAVAGDGTNRLFIVEQSGRIKIIKSQNVLPVPFLDLSKKLDRLNIAYSEEGVLGLAFHPEYKTNGRFFVYYSAPAINPSDDHASIISEFKVSLNADVADAGSEKIIMVIAQPESNHNGGMIAFGPDNMLYIGTGDGGGGGDRHGNIGNGQDLNSLLGKILRIDVDKKVPYQIPTDNPFIKPGCKPEVFAYGLRNPWKFSFDRVTGKLFCGDVGQNKFEETNVIEKGKNYGWRIMEANHCFNPEVNCESANLELPIDEYSHTEGNSITGGFVYRGKSFPSMHGYYIFGDWSGKVWALKKDSQQAWKKFDVISEGNKSNDLNKKVNSFGEDENGELYIITQNGFGPKSKTGSVYKITW